MVEGALGERLYVHSDQIDRPLLMRKDGEHYNIMTDHLGSTLGLVSEAGDVVEQYAYNAFGEKEVYVDRKDVLMALQVIEHDIEFE